MEIEELFRHLTLPEGESIDFLRFFRDYLTEHAGKKSICNYRCAYNALRRFTGQEELPVSRITTGFLQRLEASIEGVRAVSLYLSAIRTVFAAARERYNNEEHNLIRIPDNPFSRYRVPKQNRAAKRAVTSDTLRAIHRLPYRRDADGNIAAGRRNLAKDVFLLSFCLAGINSTDLFHCDSCLDNRLIYCRMKTKERRYDRAEMRIALPDFIADICRRHRDESGLRVFNFYRHYHQAGSFNRAINIGLKEIAEEIGLPTLQFYAARHSWATIARNEVRIDKATVHEALNHADRSYAITDLYIRRDFSAIDEANAKVIEYVFGKES